MRGVDAGETCGMAMCAPRGAGYMQCMHKGHGQGWWSIFHGLGADVAMPSGWPERGLVAKTGGMAGCCMASGVAWDRAWAMWGPLM